MTAKRTFRGRSVAVAVSRFNEEITSKLLKSCLAVLARAGVKARVVQVPGGFELPWTVNELALSRRYAAVIALGCVLKGQTKQNDYITASLFHHLHSISLKTRVPVILGVIAPNTWKQAVARTKGSLDRGKEAALACLEMLETRRSLKGGR